MQHFSAAVQHDSSAHDSRGHHLFHISLMFSVPHLLNSVKTTLSEKSSFKIKSLFPATLCTTLCTFFLLDFLLKGHVSSDFLHSIKLKLWQVSGFVGVTGSKHSYLTFDFRSRCLSEETLNKTVKAVAPKE